MTEATSTSSRSLINRRAGRRKIVRQQHHVSITLTGESLAAAESIAYEHNVPPGEVALRAIAVLKFLSDEQARGSVLRIQSPDGRSERLRVVFS